MAIRTPAAFLLLACACLVPAHAATPAAPLTAPLTVFGLPAAGHATARLDNALADVAARYPALAWDTALGGLHQANPALRLRLMPPRTVPQVLVDAASLGDPQALAAALGALGLEHTAVYANDIGGWLPVDQLAAAAALPQLHHLRASMPRTRAGAVSSQGDFVTHAAAIRGSSGLSGSGVTVGVLSDSFNCYAVYAKNGLSPSGTGGYAPNGFTANYANDTSSGDLPANVNVLKEADCTDYGAPVQLPLSDEGRAILQIVHDLAPGAGLAFYTAFDSEADFANGIVALAAQGATVIDDDVGYSDEPFFQDGPIAQAIDQVKAQGVSYFSSAGNNGSNSYENHAPAFNTISSSGTTVGEKLLNFDTSGATTSTTLPLQIAALGPGEFLFLVVEWDQPYVTGTSGSPGGAANALDLCVSGNSADQLYNSDGSAVTTNCTGPNSIGDDPVRMLVLGNPANSGHNTSAENISVSIGLAQGAAPGLVKFVLADDGAGSSIRSFRTDSPTLQGHPGAAGAVAVAAAYYYTTPACGSAAPTLETFSSFGGDPILFDTSGTRLATPLVRPKPELTGPDGVSNTFLGYQAGTVATSTAACQNSTHYPDFYGTSAAAPHAAAIAALLRQAQPGATPDQVLAALEHSAIAISTAPSSGGGYGLVQADGALALLSSSSSGSSSSGGSSSSSSSGGSTSSSSSSSSSSGSSSSGSFLHQDSGGGGSFGPWSLLGLAALARRRRGR